jgi:hypothetical protein
MDLESLRVRKTLKAEQAAKRLRGKGVPEAAGKRERGRSSKPASA